MAENRQSAIGLEKHYFGRSSCCQRTTASEQNVPSNIFHGRLFEAEVWADIDAGQLDRTDMPLVLTAVRRWHSDEVSGW